MAEKPWGGRFQQTTDPRVEQFTESIGFDARLARVDIWGSKIHADMLAKVGLISADECRQIVSTLDEIELDLESGRIPLRSDLEDIHMHVESALIERLGDVGRKLHTARSRNDQIATDLRLYVREAIDHVDLLLLDLQKAFLDRAERDADVILPGYTHLQRAQPVCAGHYWLAYCEKFERDRLRLHDCRERLNVSPLGCAALAGTSLPIDREFTAEHLGFDGVAANSLDVSSDRDFLVEFTFCLSLVAVHLSGWAEEWILWFSTEFGFLKLPDAYTTGSSIMPQKRNPDVLELIRGKSGRVIGSLQHLLVLLKGLPLAYNRDLQEDKLALFTAYDSVAACLDLAPSIVAGAELRRDRIAARLEEGFLDATALMEYLINKGVPMRSAHEAVGKLVAECDRRELKLADLPLDEFQSHCNRVENNVYSALGTQNAAAVLTSYGSGGPAAVAEQLRRWREKLS